MCGIAGILSFDPAKLTSERLARMTDALAHRGPDGEGHWLDPSAGIALGHRRLSIIDLSPAGAQPMACLDRYSVIHNGEIYNHIELRELLESKGYRFRSRTDTEVIPAAYDHFGPDCLKHFDGMFAFALWDRREQQLFLARDRFGEKPLYLYQDDTQFLFASEMKALWAAGIQKDLNPPMLYNFITLGYTQNPADPAETFYNSITRLPARSWLRHTTRTRRREIHQYWDPLAPGHHQEDRNGHARASDHITPHPNEPAILEEFNALMTGSVRRRLRSDVAIGASLSGGLDSSAIVAYTLGQPNPPAALPTFSATFPGFEKDESAYIREVTRQFNLANFSTTPTAADFIADFDRVAAQQEEPFESTSIYAQFRVYSLARSNGIKVLLDGQGADELLAGYLKYFPWYWRELYREDRGTLAKELAAASGSSAAGSSAASGSSSASETSERWSLKHRLAARWPDLARSVWQRSRIARQRAHKDLARDFVQTAGTSYYHLPPVTRLNEVLYYNTLTNGLEELLRYSDRNSMAHGVETRLPFLDHRLAEFVLSLPANLKIRDGWTKWILRMNTKAVLPPDIVWRKDKTGYEPPQHKWMTEPAVLDRIGAARTTLVGKGILDRAVLQKKIQPMGAHAAENYDWRYLIAAACLA